MLQGGAGADVLRIDAASLQMLAAGAMSGGTSSGTGGAVQLDTLEISGMGSGAFNLSSLLNGTSSRISEIEIIDLRNSANDMSLSSSIADLITLTSANGGASQPLTVRLDSGESYNVSDLGSDYSVTTQTGYTANGLVGTLHSYYDANNSLVAQLHVGGGGGG